MAEGLCGDVGGTITPPAYTLNVTENGTYPASQYSQVVVNVGGGGGGTLEMESGTVTLSENQIGLDISFANSHSAPPVYFAIAADVTGQTYNDYPANGLIFVGGRFTDILGVPTIDSKLSNPYHYEGMITRVTKGSSTTTSSALSVSTGGSNTWEAYVTAQGFNISITTFGPGTYKWHAIWKTW